jgi:23S rRNA (cytosine1962-C5)-methyltransferase
MSIFSQQYFTAFQDFALLDTGNGLRLEQWGPYRLSRPDPQIIWERQLPPAEWQKADATFDGSGERGKWIYNNRMPESWPIRYILPGTNHEVSFKARLTPFKHTGIFAEQAANWEWMAARLTQKKERKILNLFGYTGAASVLLTSLGHSVTHVDASKPAIGWAKENQELNMLPADSIRWILDDAAKFVAREVKRGQKYDGIVMDPPAFGHSPDGKTWKFNKDLPGLLRDCVSILSDDADFLLINGYATNSSAIALHNVLEDMMKEKKGALEHGELCLSQQSGRLISTGIFARWHS